MSAFVCNDSHITAVASYAARHRLSEDRQTDAKPIAEMLYAANVASVNYLYPATDQTGEFTLCSWAFFRTFPLIQIIKAAYCLEYQSCERPEWKDSAACKLLKAIVRHATCELPGYRDAMWEIERYHTEAVKQPVS